MPKRHYPRHRPSAVKELYAYLRGRWKLFAIILGGVAGTFASVGTIAKNWDAVEPSFLASRGWTRDLVKLAQSQQPSVLPAIRDLQIESAEGKKSQALNSVANWKLEKTKAKDPVTQGLIDQQITNQENEVSRLNGQIRTLNRLKQEGK